MGKAELLKLFEQPVPPEWETPVPLDSTELPSFNIDIFPKWLKDYALAVAEETQTPIEAAAMASISMLSTILSKKFDVSIRGGWKETLNTYTILSLPPSSRKSSVFNAYFKPLAEYEAMETKRLAPIVREESRKIDLIKKKIAKLEQKFMNENNEQKCEVIQREIEAEYKKLPLSASDKTTPPRFFTSDVTPEKLAALMAVHNEKMAVLSAEGGEVISMMLGLYSGKIQIDLYLKGYSGDNVTIDRKNSDSIILKNPTLTVGLMVQPSVIRELPSNFSDRGLVQRMLFFLPKTSIGTRRTGADVIPMPASIEEEFNSKVEKLVKMEYPKTEDDAEEITLAFENGITLNLSEDAQIHLHKIEAENEVLLRDQNNSETFEGFVGKLTGNIIRIAGLLHVAEHVDTSYCNVPKTIEYETLKKADSIRRFLIKHAESAFGVIGEGENVSEVKFILSRIVEMTKDGSTLIYRDLLRSVNRRFKAEDLKNILTLLEEMGYIRLENQGRKVLIQVNPLI